MQLSNLSARKRASEPEDMPFIDFLTGNPAEDENGEPIIFQVVGTKSNQFSDAMTEIARLKTEGHEISDHENNAIVAAYCTTGYSGCIEVGENPLDIDDKKAFADLLLSGDFDLLNQLVVAVTKKQGKLISQPSSTDTESSPGYKQPQTKTGSPETKAGAKRDRPKNSQS